MSKRQHGRQQELSPAPWSHLPPIEASTLLVNRGKGKITVPTQWKLETPVDKNGIPVPSMILQEACETLDANYIFPPIRAGNRLYNDHHTAYPAYRYYQHPSGLDIPGRYRDSSSLIMRIQIQLHNYIHVAFEPPKEPHMDVMEQWSQEQEQVDELFTIGKESIRLSRIQYNDEPDEKIREDLKRQARIEAVVQQAVFYEYLDRCDSGQLGLMPEKEELASLPFMKAVRSLGILAGARSLNYSRHTYDVLRRVGYRDSGNAAA